MIWLKQLNKNWLEELYIVIKLFKLTISIFGIIYIKKLQAINFFKLNFYVSSTFFIKTFYHL